MAALSGADIVRGLVQRGYTPVQAAALAGHMQQESGLDPENVNPDEGAHGLLQWEGPRWTALQGFANKRGASPTDPNVQLDFIGDEMSGPEARSSAGFKNATDIDSASAALKQYIRFANGSEGKRLNYGRAIMGLPASTTDIPSSSGTASASPLGVAGVGSSGATGAATPAADTSQDQSIAALAAIPKTLMQQRAADTPAPLQLEPAQPIQTPAMIRARQLAQAMMARSLNPGGTT